MRFPLTLQSYNGELSRVGYPVRRQSILNRRTDGPLVTPAGKLGSLLSLATDGNVSGKPPFRGSEISSLNRSQNILSGVQPANSPF